MRNINKRRALRLALISVSLLAGCAVTFLLERPQARASFMRLGGRARDHTWATGPQASPGPPGSDGSEAPEPALRNKFGTPVVAYRGAYINEQYMFRLLVPSGESAVSSPPPSPQHGFTVELSPDPHVIAQITVFAMYGLDNSSIGRHVASEIEDRKRVLSAAQVSGPYQFTLGGTSAVPYGVAANRFVVAGVDQKSGKSVVVDEVAALRKVPNQAGPTWYTVSLSTEADRYQQDRPVLEALLDSWENILVDWVKSPDGSTGRVICSEDGGRTWADCPANSVTGQPSGG
jgi:hypothetical protein